MPSADNSASAAAATTDIPPVPLFSLAELAHFNRCLFSGDFENDLIRVGMSPADARMYAAAVRAPNRRDLLALYQDNIGDADFLRALTAILTEFVDQYPNR